MRYAVPNNMNFQSDPATLRIPSKPTAYFNVTHMGRRLGSAKMEPSCHAVKGSGSRGLRFRGLGFGG